MEIRKVDIKDLIPADYNPRKDLQPGDPEYEKLKKSIEGFGYVEPIVWNEDTGRIVGGHQRLKILAEMGEKAVDCVVINVKEQDEKILNVLLNKVKGRWDIEVLADLLTELNDEGLMELTGFEDWELESLETHFDHIDDLMNEDFGGYDEGKEQTTFTMTFSFPEEQRQMIESFLAEDNAKEVLCETVVKKAKGV